MSFDYREAVDLDTITRFSVAELRDHLRHALAGGWRVLAFFGIPEEKVLSDQRDAGIAPTRPVPIILCCILAHDGTRRLMARCTNPVTAFMSLTPDLPQMHYFEREIYEQWGVEPVDHPWLKSVRRIPDSAEAQARNAAAATACGDASLASEDPAASSPDTAAAPQPPAQPYPLYRVEGGEVHEVAVGPVHAGIIEPGHFRFQCYGENVLHLEIALGYQHRGLENMLVHGPAARRLHLLECAAGDTTVAHATAHCVLLERMTGQQPDERAQLLRRIGLELERLANHTGDLGAIAGDTGFLPTSSWNGRIRGDFLNITASLCGNRFGRGLLRPGGVAYDLDSQECASLLNRTRAAWQDARGAVDIMLDAATVRDRLVDTGILETGTARDLGLVGVPARACGLDVDARFHAPLSDLPCEGCAPRLEITGDVMARAKVRSRELDDSLRLLEQDFTRLSALWAQNDAPCASPVDHKDGPACAAPVKNAGRAWRDFSDLPPHTLAVAQVEGWRGEVCHVAVTDSQGRLLTYKVIDPSFRNWTGLAIALRGNQISDFPLCNKSFNLSYCGHDL